MKEYLIHLVEIFSPEAATALLATFPLTELRAALPVGITVFGLSPLEAFTYAVLGNILPLLVVFLILPPMIRYAEQHSPRLRKFLQTYFRSLEKKHREKYDRYGALALILFVAIPLPGSGVWTGSVLAVLFGVERRFSIPAILVGLLLSGVIVLLITQGALGMLSFLL